MAAWSEDLIERDEEGFLYFVGQNDEMIKTCDYRVSPTEIEEVAYNTGMVCNAVALGIDGPRFGQHVVLFVSPTDGAAIDLMHCSESVPGRNAMRYRWKDRRGARQNEVVTGRSVAQADCPFGAYNGHCLRKLKRSGFELVNHSSDGRAARASDWLQRRSIRAEPPPNRGHKGVVEQPAKGVCGMSRSFRTLVEHLR